jgi:hypothetical protein
MKNDVKDPSSEKTRFVSAIAGQMMDDDENINIPFMLISLFAGTLTFLLSLSWAAFLSDSVETVQRITKNKIPLPLARLIAAIIVSMVAVSLLVLLFNWERKVKERKRQAQEDEEQ